MKGPGHQRRRIILLFGFGIVLPSLLLGYLAFRGIQNDRALSEQQRLEGIRQAAVRIVRTVDTGIAAAEQALTGAVAGRPRPNAAAIRAALLKLASDHPLVEQVFLLRASKEVLFPAAKPLYLPDGSRETAAPVASGAASLAGFLAAQRLEFRGNDLPGALAAYRQALRQTKEPYLVGLILSATARIQKKSGLLREARSTYETITRDHGRTIIAGGMPLGPSAALEICALSRQLGDGPASLRQALGLYRSLLGREWDLEKAEFELFLDRVKEHIAALFEDPPPGLDVRSFKTESQALAAEEAALRDRTERMALFGSSAAPTLEARIAAAASQDASASLFVRSTLEIGNADFLVSVERLALTDAASAGDSWGLLLDVDKLRENILRPAVNDSSVSGLATWLVKSKDGQDLLASDDLPSGPVAFTTNFVSNAPAWTLEFHEPPPHSRPLFLLSRRGLYFFVFLLIAGILVFGLALTLRSVSHELELARMKSDFVSTVSHEFKSPLTSIRQLAEMLQSGRAPTEERRQKYYEVLLEQSERLALLTDNILSLAKIEEGRARLVLERTDIPGLLRGVVSTFRDRIGHEGFEIALEVRGNIPPLAIDRTAVSQALANLVDNAVKYSGASRRIEVSAVAENAEVAITVRDFGIGIKKDDIPRLFERFFRAGDELTRTVKGSGLGLTLVKEIIDAHGGRVDVASEPGKGSAFAVRLPIPGEKEDRP
jgi:signal transduction histidine kinase